MKKIDFYINSIDTEDGVFDLKVAENMCNTFLYPEFLLKKYSQIKCIDDKAIKRVLDVGCGAGPLSVFFAKKGKMVEAIDINPIAIECCKVNILENNLQELMTVRKVGIEEYKSTEKYDMIVCNPPYGDDSYMRKNMSSNLEVIIRKMNKNIFDAEVDDFLTNCWKDKNGKDMVDYILEKSNELLNSKGYILLVCGNDFIDSKKYMTDKVVRYSDIEIKYQESFRENICLVDGEEKYSCEKIYNILVFQMKI